MSDKNPGVKAGAPRPLHKIFTEVPGQYDLINRLFTLRLDESWRKKAVKECLADKPQRIMDLCTGTGDLAMRLSRNSSNGTQITGYDYSPPMLEIAKEKVSKAGLQNIRLVHGDAADMPFDDGQFDTIGIAFAFRNLTYKNPDTPKFLAEINRVLRKGGRFVIVESSQPASPIMKALSRIYTKIIVYRLGSLISGNKAAYRYLAYSVINYYKPEEIVALLKQYGFSQISYKRLFGGVAAIHTAIK